MMKINNHINKSFCLCCLTILVLIIPFLFINQLYAADQETFEFNATASPQSGVAPLKVQFNAQVKGRTEPLKYDWNFIDSHFGGSLGIGQSSISDSIYIYETAGVYSPTVRFTPVDMDFAPNKYNSFARKYYAHPPKITVYSNACEMHITQAVNNFPRKLWFIEDLKVISLVLHIFIILPILQFSNINFENLMPIFAFFLLLGFISVLYLRRRSEFGKGNISFLSFLLLSLALLIALFGFFLSLPCSKEMGLYYPAFGEYAYLISFILLFLPPYPWDFLRAFLLKFAIFLILGLMIAPSIFVYFS